eukprot:gnl/TRDRNA2_/TRDRNA2_165077_c0_seq1.p1 gnl/TRDRNA2_/TRDRNA2_165077_c0~~gnl/TRDRNA2_/TRDRNA2_165077_c0_seq1.p1  ORF type:complete len:400 (+),score=47.32 gnl/TRDRNA2_/TRDRNA2_165077_c0_seq1:2-1201(+)
MWGCRLCNYDICAPCQGMPQDLQLDAIVAAGGASSSTSAAPCPMGAACPDLGCKLQHPLIPGMSPAVKAGAKVCFFVVRSNTLTNIQTSVRTGVWATSRFNTQVIEDARRKADHIVLIFSANQTGHFQGYGVMSSKPSPDLMPGLWGRMSSRLGDNFKVQWIKQCMLPFSQTDNLKNVLNNYSPLRKSRDGQEVPCDVGTVVARLMYQQRDEDILSLPADAEPPSDLALCDRSPSRRRSNSRRRGRSRRRSRSPRSRSAPRRGEPPSKVPRLEDGGGLGALGPEPLHIGRGSAPPPKQGGLPPEEDASKAGGPAWAQRPAGGWSVPHAEVGVPPGMPPPAWGPPPPIYPPPPAWGGPAPPHGGYQPVFQPVYPPGYNAFGQPTGPAGGPYYPPPPGPRR